MRLLPPTTIPGRILAISVKLGHLSATDRTAARRAAVEPLLRAFEQYQIPATWAFDAPEAVDAFPRSHAAAMGHEVAASEISGDARQARTALVAHLRDFRQAGIPVTTLLCATNPAAADFESLVRMGVNLVAVGSAGSTTTEPIVTLRFGLWQMATSWEIPSEGWLGGAWGAARGRRRLDQAIRRNEPFHVMIDGAEVLRSTTAARALERLLRHVDRRREQGMLSVVTLSEVAQQLARPRVATRAESILRSRAA